MATEYPFWARWVVDNVPAADITSVNYDVTVYNPTTDIFDSVETGTISAADAQGKWIAPYDVPDTTGTFKYVTIFTPTGGSHTVLHDEVVATDGAIGASSGSGSGTETHTGVVCDRNNNPLEGVLVRATPYGTTYTFATDTTNASGEYTITGLHANHGYEISFNKDGYWAKQSGLVIP